MSNRTTVLFFHISSGTFGGGSKMLLRLIKSLDQEEFHPVLLSQHRDEVALRAANSGIEVHVVPFKGVLDTYDRSLLSLSPLQAIAVGIRILQFNLNVRKILECADIIWCKNLRAVLTLSPYMPFSRTPILWNIGLGMHSEGKVRHLNSIALRLADYIFIESETQAERVFTPDQYKKHQNKFTSFYKGIDLDEFNPERVDQVSNDKQRIGMAAILAERKGVEYLIEAMPAILKHHPETELVIAGKAKNEEYKQYLEGITENLGIEKNVRFVGWMNNMPSFLASLDVFVLPSHNEGVSGAVREAMAMEVPVVATDVGGISEAIIDEKTGFLVTPRESNEIADTVIYVFNNQIESKKVAKRGKQHVEQHFSIESYVSNYESFLRYVVGK